LATLLAWGRERGAGWIRVGHCRGREDWHDARVLSDGLSYEQRMAFADIYREMQGKLPRITRRMEARRPRQRRTSRISCVLVTRSRSREEVGNGVVALWMESECRGRASCIKNVRKSGIWC
jgi:hypothetical protein